MYRHDYYTDRAHASSAEKPFGTEADADSITGVDGDGSMMDVRWRLRPQHIRSILVLLLRLKGTSIQLVQGNKWVSGLRLEGDASAAATRASCEGFFSWMPRYPWQLFAPQLHLTFSPKCTNLQGRGKLSLPIQNIPSLNQGLMVQLIRMWKVDVKWNLT
jgi:hypothetical protein